MNELLKMLPQPLIYWLVGALMGVTILMGRIIANRFADVWEQTQSDLSGTKDLLTGLNTEVTLQRTNCLTTLQDQGREQIAILHEIATSVSYLRGKNDAN